MAAVSQIAQVPPHPQLRPLNPRRDLAAIADLVELCFADTIDPDGQRYLSRMRQAAHIHGRHWFDSAVFQVSVTTEGFVWEEAGKIVGNISLIPFTNLGRPIYLIANVAVHPDYRRKSIARSLTTAALEWTRKRHIHSVWLQVRDNNPAAVKLYESLGFIERARRTTWTVLPGNLKGEGISDVRIVPQKSRHWKLQRAWLRQNYPDELFWYWPLNPTAFRPGILGALINLFTETNLRHWGVERKGDLLGILSWKASTTYADQLWLAAPPENEDIVLQTIFSYIRWRDRARRPLSIDYPVGRAANTLHEAGFRPDHTLIWMEINS